MPIWIDQKYETNSDTRRTGNEVGITRMCRHSLSDTWAMSPEMAMKLGFALIEAAKEFNLCEHSIGDGEYCKDCRDEYRQAEIDNGINEPQEQEQLKCSAEN